jgi:hypothetical protein
MITIIPAGAQVQSDGAPVASIAAVGTVAGCPLPIATGSAPCTTVTWTTGAVKVTLNGVPALLATSPAIFNSTPPVAGVPATVVQTQTHATAT